MNLSFIAEVTLGGLLAGVMYSLVALGFVLIYKASGVFNYAQGSMVLFAALSFVGLLESGAPIWLALPATIAIMIALAWLVERLVLRPLVNQEQITLFMATIGIAFFLDPRWISVMGVKTPDQSLVTNLQAWIGFGTAFGFGWFLHRQVDLLRILERRWLWNLLPAIALILICFVLAGISLSSPGAPKPPVSPTTLRQISAVLYALAIWTSTFAVIGLALRFMSGFSPVRRYLADASYWLYLIHMPIVMALQVALSQLDWPAPIKLTIILGVAIAVMLVSYHVLVRFTVIGVVLNGKRAPRAAAPAAVVTGSAAP